MLVAVRIERPTDWSFIETFAASLVSIDLKPPVSSRGVQLTFAMQRGWSEEGLRQNVERITGKSVLAIWERL